ncbi:tumor necrosis factor receptor superfamily member 25 isoform X3 [Marmota flaviventris]|uniref:tumor necrosis factor receptor superfamily member 25 isoform X3 n=1 Tax=Marmota flaviventris TaxID=93162 RepID=UPI003A85E467
MRHFKDQASSLPQPGRKPIIRVLLRCLRAWPWALPVSLSQGKWPSSDSAPWDAGLSHHLDPHPGPLGKAVLLLLLGVQGSFPGPRCDCTRDFQERNGPFCCRGCPVAFQVALENCSAVADTRCGCEPGWMIDCSVKPCRENSPFLCRRCPDCEALYTDLPCSSRDADCGPCLPGFYEYGNGCVSCPTSILGSCPEPCAAVCGWRQMFWAQVLVAGLVVLFLLGGTLIYTYRRCQPHKPVVPAEKAGTEAPTPLQATQLSASESAHTLLVPPGSSGKVCTIQLVDNSRTPDCPQIQEVPCQQVPQSWYQLPSRDLGPPLAPPLSPAPSAGSPAAVLQPGPQLYDVMDAVPARRWKEFVRTLGLREAEIEAVEVEIGRFRDQQYEMLKRWRQQQPAGLGAVYAALERMGLDGCAEDLRSRLQRGA